MRRTARLQSAGSWLQGYDGDRKKLAKAYRKRYRVDYATAFRELEMLGIEIDSAYKEEILRSVERQAEYQRQRKQLQQIKVLSLDAKNLIMGDEELDSLLEAYGTVESSRLLDSKRHGHYCRKCGRHRANERFSGRGHAKHICKDCQKEMRQHARQKCKERLAKQNSLQSSESSISDESGGNK